MIRCNSLFLIFLILILSEWLILPAHGFFGSKKKSKEKQDSKPKEVLVEIQLHRNGEADPCLLGITEASWNQTIVESSHSFFRHSDFAKLDKYATEALFTLTFHNLLSSSNSCAPPDEDGAFFRNFCDMGKDRTVIWPDHDQLIPITATEHDDFLPCHFHTREGVRITSLEKFYHYLNKTKTEKVDDNECMADSSSSTKDNGKNSQKSCPSENNVLSFHVYAVAAGRPFMFAPKFVGEIFEIENAPTESGLPISLEVMSLSPRVLEVKNFFSKTESEKLVARALAEKKDSHRIKRSSTGASGYNLNNGRTSENGFDTNGKIAMDIKRRCFDVLGFDEYTESFADGLQILRYNLTTAYIPHLDWIDDIGNVEHHNYDSSKIGTNRFATILLYMTDIGKEDGGETVFANALPLGQSSDQLLSDTDALQQLRDTGDVKDILEQGSWEEKMVAQCRSRLSVQPRAAKAVLFYSQHPDGKVDSSSLHGGCPVLRGVKWAANLWVWNGPRNGYDGEPLNSHAEKSNNKNNDGSPYTQKLAKFVNTGTDATYANCALYFQDTYWGSFSHGDDMISVNTYPGHEWNVISTTGETLKTWYIDTRNVQEYFV